MRFTIGRSAVLLPHRPKARPATLHAANAARSEHWMSLHLHFVRVFYRASAAGALAAGRRSRSAVLEQRSAGVAESTPGTGRDCQTGGMPAEDAYCQARLLVTTPESASVRTRLHCTHVVDILHQGVPLSTASGLLKQYSQSQIFCTSTTLGTQSTPLRRGRSRHGTASTVPSPALYAGAL